MSKGKNILLFLLVVIFIVGSAGVGYYMGTNNQSNGIKNVENNEDNKMNDETVDELGRKLFDETSSNYSLWNYYFYDSDKLTVDNMNLDDKLFVTMRHINFKDIYYNQVKDLTSQECLSLVENADGFNYTCYAYKVNKTVFADVYYELFNQNMPSFNYFIYLDSLDFRGCKLEDNEIKCYPIEAGSDGSPEMKWVNYDKAEFYNGNLYVYSNFIGFGFESDTDNYYAYSDYDLTKKIDKVDYSSEFEKYYNNKISMFDDIEQLFTKFKDKTGKYKLTFKQRENGIWYWESTEVVK